MPATCSLPAKSALELLPDRSFKDAQRNLGAGHARRHIPPVRTRHLPRRQGLFPHCRPCRSPAPAHQPEPQAVPRGHGPRHRLQKLRREPARPVPGGGGGRPPLGPPRAPARGPLPARRHGVALSAPPPKKNVPRVALLDPPPNQARLPLRTLPKARDEARG